MEEEDALITMLEIEGSDTPVEGIGCVFICGGRAPPVAITEGVTGRGTEEIIHYTICSVPTRRRKDTRNNV